MKYPRIVDRVPVPIRPSYESWRTWCMKVSDELVDLFPEYQKASLESEALYSAAATAIYKIPSGCFGPVEDLTFFSLLLASMELLGVETYLALAKRTGGHFRYLPAVVPKFCAGLESAKISASEWAECVGVDPRETRLWVACGTHLLPGTRAVVDAWVQVMCPWPIPAELREYFSGLNQEN